MIFGNAAWGFREASLEEQLKITSDMGLDVLELGIANAPVDIGEDASDEEIENVKKLFKKYGVRLMCAATGNDFTNGSSEDVDKLKKVILICQKLGVRYLRIFAGFSPVDEVVGERWNIMISCLKEVYGFAKGTGVVPVVETHGGVTAFADGVEHFYSTSSKPEILYKMLDSVPEMMINYDPANLYAVGINNPDRVYQNMKDRVCYVHLKDFVKIPSGHLVPGACGESDMDWTEILKSLEYFDGPALFEYENPKDVKDGCLRCLNYVKKLLKEIKK